MRLGVPKESYPGERRVAIVPGSIPPLAKLGLEVAVERGAGLAAGFPDREYEAKGAQLVSRPDALGADLVVMVRSYGTNPEAGAADLAGARPGQTWIATADPLSHPDRAQKIADRGVNLFALELMPRITRAQSMDVLSSMGMVAGYQAVLWAAHHLPKMFPMSMTAAGTVQAARVFVIGAGVAGLQAIATAKRLGAVVQAYDVRPAVKEQVQSLGAKFVELKLDAAQAEDKGGYAKALGDEFYQKQRELMKEVVRGVDVVITTAAIPGKKSPLLIPKDAVEVMSPGSVIVDLAAERGGNCELTQLDRLVEHNGVSIYGPGNLPATIPFHASQMFSNNVTTFLKHLVKEGALKIDLDDEITRETLVSKDGKVIHPRVAGPEQKGAG
jgi:NAD(P) transhydrogenase subunit alpha